MKPDFDFSKVAEHLVLRIDSSISSGENQSQVLAECKLFINEMIRENGQILGLLDAVEEYSNEQRLKAACYKVSYEALKEREQCQQ